MKTSIGNMKFEEVVSTVSKYLEAIPEKISENIRQAPPVNQTQVLEIKRASTQAHCVMGRQAYTMHDERRLPFFMLTNLLGGQGMNSRFNLSLREKHGLVYGIDASYNTFVDTGFFGIYYATDAKQLKKANDLIWKEMQILVNQPLTKTQLQAVRNQMMGQLAMAEESNMSFMLMMAKSLLDSNRIESLIEIFDAIKAVSVEQIQDIAKVMFNPSEMSQLTFVPKGKG
jgi:predicted Zn-dependent peptidase